MYRRLIIAWFLLVPVLGVVLLIFNYDTPARRQLINWRVDAILQTAQNSSQRAAQVARLMELAEGGYDYGSFRALWALGELQPDSALVAQRIGMLLAKESTLVSSEAAKTLERLGAAATPAKRDLLRAVQVGPASSITTVFAIDALGAMGVCDSEVCRTLQSRLGYSSLLDEHINRALNRLNCAPPVRSQFYMVPRH